MPLIIKDLTQAEELNSRAMSIVRGGLTAMPKPSLSPTLECHPHYPRPYPYPYPNPKPSYPIPNTPNDSGTINF